MRLVVVPLALTELHDAAVFYAEKANAEFGLAFVAEFERTTRLILENPLLGTVFVMPNAAIFCAGFLTASSIRLPLRN